MKIEEFTTCIVEKTRKTGIMLLEEQIKKLYKYMNILIEWNQKINLTAITKPEEIIEKHFIDSLTILPYIKEKQKIIDVGTGAGFPGIPLNIAKSDIECTLIDSLNKRINFLNEVIEQLELKNIKAIHTRAEEYAIKNREIYDIAVSRAVANMSTLAEYLLPFVKKDGIVIMMKGPNIEQEIEESKKAIKELGGKIEEIKNFKLGENERNLIVIRKIKDTPKQYPRKAGKPLKEPIK